MPVGVNKSLYHGLVLWDAVENRLYEREQLASLDPSSSEIWMITLTELPGRLSSTERSILRGRDGVIIVVDATTAHVIYAMDQLEGRKRF